MKGTEKIIAHIEADAGAQAEEILSKARTECESIRAGYAREAEAVYAGARSAAEAEASSILESAGRTGDMEARKLALDTRQQQVSEAFRRAMEAIPSLPEGRYEEFMVRLVLSAMSTGDEEVILNARDAAAFGGRLISRVNGEKQSHLTLSSENHEYAGGLILRHGQTGVNATLELLLEQTRRELSHEVAQVLFG